MAETDGTNTRGRRALIVEQDREDAGLIGFHLKRQGLPTMVVSSLSEAWDAMSWGTPDVVVVELGSPDVDALEFAVSLSGKTAALFVVAGRTPTADEELTLLRLGVREIFLKPMDHRAVTQKMSTAEVRPLPQNSEIHASSIRGILVDHPVDVLLDLARRHSLNARLMIQSPGQGEGSLVIRDGTVIDGVRGETSGRAAVLATAATMAGHFDLSLLDAEDPALAGEDLVGMDLAGLMSAAFEARAPHPKTRRPRARQRPTTIPPGMAKRLIQEEKTDDDSAANSAPSTRFGTSPWTAVHQKSPVDPQTIHSGVPVDMPSVAPPSAGPKPRPRAGHGERRQPDSSIVRTEFEDRNPDNRFDVGTDGDNLELDASDLQFLEGGTSSTSNPMSTDTDAKTLHQQAPNSKVMMPESEGGDYLVFESNSSPARTMVQQTQARERGDSARRLTGSSPTPSVLEDMGDTDKLMPSLSGLDVDSRPLSSAPPAEPVTEAKQRDPDEDLLPSGLGMDEDLLPSGLGMDEDLLPSSRGMDDDLEGRDRHQEPRSRSTPSRPRQDSNTLLPSLDDLELPSTRREEDTAGETTPSAAVDYDDGPPTREEEEGDEGETSPNSPALRPISRPISRAIEAPLSRSMDLDDDLGAEFKSGGGKIFRRLLLVVLAIAFVFLAVKFGQRIIDSNPSTAPGASLVATDTDSATPASAAPTVSDRVAKISGMEDGAPARTYALGVQAMKKKDFADASKRFRLVLSEVPDHAGAMAGLFQTLMLQGDYEDAGKQLEKLFEAKPDDPKLFFHKALLAQKTGDGVTARTSLNTFLERVPEHPWAPKAKKILSTMGEDQP